VAKSPPKEGGEVLLSEAIFLVQDSWRRQKDYQNWMPTANVQMGMAGQILAGFCIKMTWGGGGLRYNQSTGRNGLKASKGARNEGIEMENITRKVDDSFRCFKKVAAAKKSQKISFNYSVLQLKSAISLHAPM
jgi:hypothetical protein